jgi:trehalose-6-phosphate hydrolase
MDLVTTGEYQLLLPDHPDLFVYLRKGKDEHLLVINNFRAQETDLDLPNQLDWHRFRSKILLSNYEDTSNLTIKMRVRPYESIVYHLIKKEEMDDEKGICNR